jgi:hypothetical protein
MRILIQYLILSITFVTIASTVKAELLPVRLLVFKNSAKRDNIDRTHFHRDQDTSALGKKKIKEIAKPRPQVKPERVEMPPVIIRPPSAAPDNARTRPGAQVGRGQGNTRPQNPPQRRGR